MTPREKLGLDLAREIVKFVHRSFEGRTVDAISDRVATVLAQELDDETMETLRVAFAARNARTVTHGSRAGGPSRRR